MRIPGNSMQVLHQLYADPTQNQANLIEMPSKSYTVNPMPIIGKSYTNPVELAQIIANSQKASQISARKEAASSPLDRSFRSEDSIGPFVGIFKALGHSGRIPVRGLVHSTR